MKNLLTPEVIYWLEKSLPEYASFIIWPNLKDKSIHLSVYYLGSRQSRIIFYPCDAFDIRRELMTMISNIGEKRWVS